MVESMCINLGLTKLHSLAFKLKKITAAASRQESNPLPWDYEKCALPLCDNRCLTLPSAEPAPLGGTCTLDLLDEMPLEPLFG